jgi:hypothetical protein
MQNEIKGEKRDQRAAIVFRHSIDQRERVRYVKWLARPKKGEERTLALRGRGPWRTFLLRIKVIPIGPIPTPRYYLSIYR